MQRLLFRCIDTLIDASALERRAFNIAFAQSGLTWHWSATRFASLKQINGERHRIAWFAEHIENQPISCAQADVVRWRKEQALSKLLQHDLAVPRPGALRILRDAATAQIQTILTLPTGSQRQIFNATARHFDPLSAIRITNPDTHGMSNLNGNTPKSILFDSAITTYISPQGITQPCITLLSNVTGARACITHFGENNNLAVQLSGIAILRKGSASLQSLLSLESSRATSE